MSTSAPQAGRWYAACLYAGNAGWAVVRDVAQPGTRFGGPGHYQQEAAPGRYVSQHLAQRVADELNSPPKPIRLRSADRYGELPGPGDEDYYHPSPWDLK